MPRHTCTTCLLLNNAYAQGLLHGIFSLLPLLAVIGRAASAAGQILGGSKGDSWSGSMEDYEVQNNKQSHASRLRSSTVGRRNGSFSAVLPLTQMQDQVMPEINTTGFGTSKAVLIDLGFYQWRPDGPTQPVDGSAVDAVTQAAAQQAAQGGLLHLVQVQSQRLAPRMLLFDWPLKACEGEDALLQQLLPGFLDAPGTLTEVGWCDDRETFFA
jgi:hypothetical protein